MKALLLEVLTTLIALGETEATKLIESKVVQGVITTGVGQIVQKTISDISGLLGHVESAHAADPPPVADAPVVDAPAVDAPAVDAPVVDAPVVDAPVVDAPVVDAPVVDAPVDADRAAVIPVES